MSLTQGTRLASYEIIGPLGAGGMGEVYRARDTKLDRDVAIKVLPDLFAADPDRLARFEREAKTLAAVNHPNIAQVHGVIEQPPALVMELVEGEDLAQLLARGLIPLDQALPIARQIAEALEAAHERGIIHRDLKPANVKVRDDGTVKVLDFGLAKALAPEGVGAAADAMNSPTLTSPMTQMGMILGTAAYMAPEQAKGKSIDKRADIWAFGVVLFEMLTGRRAFDGESITDVLSAVTRDEPRWAELPSSTPASIRSLLQRCLEKDPRRRLRDIGDARIELESRVNENADLVPTLKSDIRRVPLWVFATGILVTALAASVLGAAWARARFAPPAASPGITGRAAIQVPGLGDIRSSSASLIAMSPDGALLIYGTTFRAGSGNLHARRLDSLDSQPIEGTVGAQGAFVSHDGRLVGFQREGEIFTVAVSGGPVTRLKGSAHLPEGRPAWTPDGRIVYTGPRGELLMVRTDRSQPERLTQPERGERHLSPHVLPDGRTALFTTVGTDVNQARIAAISLADRQVRTLVADGAMTAQYADGFLFYVRPDRTLMAVPFDPVRVELSGDPVALPDRVNRTRFGVAHYAAAAHVLVYVPSSRTRLVEVDRGGRSQTLVAEERSWHHPRYSPDGTRIVMDLTFGGIDRDVWMFDRGTKTLSRITRIGDAHDPSWLPDGKDVSFFSFKSPDGPLMLAASDGASEPRPIRINRGFTPADLVNPGRWLPDGSAFLGGVKDAGAPSDIWRIPRDGSDPQKLVSSSYDELAPAVSLNGRWLAYQSDETGRPEVYVRAVNGPGRVQVSNTGGTEPVWDPSADVLYYVEADGDRRHIVAATLRTTPKLAIDARTITLSAVRLDESDNHPNYDIHPNGKTFVMPELEANAGLVAIFDWLTSVRDRAASRRQDR